ncbi:MAG: hypothetical protein WC288_03020 [Candidatus Paceibacterota bacterium]|jgi:amino acid transporter|nr:TrbC/VirB2 family protein [Candidatus Paceibacterota bacterium]MDD4998935.1 TrbC/VirB2 family protein [Candidatus Paceibacterota bacterium]
MRKRILNLSKTIIPIILLIMLLPAAIKAEGLLNIENPLKETSDISELINRIIDILFTVAIWVAPIIIVYAGFQYVTSAGNPEKIKSAQRTLIYAMIGFAIVLIAKAVPDLIKEFLTVKN